MSTYLSDGLSQRFVQRLDDAGNVLDQWTSTSDETSYFGDPFVAYVGGQPYVVYAEPKVDYEPSPVRMMHLACGY